ncbi:MAG: alpha/beta hydrolase [Emcibacter sp.]|nr:alpha/beta hydrolase [Emcibacter sp.]
MPISEEKSYLRRAKIGNVELAYTDQGAGEPIVFIHGSWDDHHSWDCVTKRLSFDYRTVTYDRRGHSASTDIARQGHLSEDVQDALDLIEELNLGPSHIIGHSYGANVAITLASTAPEKTLSLFVHEPPVFSLLSGNDELDTLRIESAGLMKKAAKLIIQGEIEEGARLFIEKVAFGEDSWNKVFNESSRTVILSNVDTWLDQSRDPERLVIDVSGLKDYPNKITFSTGTESLPTYKKVTERISEILPQANIAKIEGGAHGSHISHPILIAKAIVSHLNELK